MTIFFRRLADVPVHLDPEASDEALLAPLVDAYYAPDDLSGAARARTLVWLRRYGACTSVPKGRPRCSASGRMNAVNPKYVLRNCLAQGAIDAAEKGDASLVVELLDLLRHPYDEQPEREAGLRRWKAPRLGARSRGMLDALLQLLTRPKLTRASGRFRC